MRRFSTPVAAVQTAILVLTLIALAAPALAQSVPPEPVVLSTFEERLVEYIVLGIIGLFVAAAVVGVATTAGFLPEKRTGFWRIFTVIDVIGDVICLVWSFGSSSSKPDGFSGGRGSFGGGGSSGKW